MEIKKNKNEVFDFSISGEEMQYIARGLSLCIANGIPELIGQCLHEDDKTGIQILMGFMDDLHAILLSR